MPFVGQAIGTTGRSSDRLTLEETNMQFSSRPHPLVLLRRTAAVLAAALVPVVPALAQAAPDYSGFTAARFIPFVAAMSPVNSPYHPPALRFAIRGRNYTATMDTGSTGVMLSASRIPGYTPKIACQDPSSLSGLGVPVEQQAALGRPLDSRGDSISRRARRGPGDRNGPRARRGVRGPLSPLQREQARPGVSWRETGAGKADNSLHGRRLRTGT